jgi:hypothetical protein
VVLVYDPCERIRLSIGDSDKLDIVVYVLYSLHAGGLEGGWSPSRGG